MHEKEMLSEEEKTIKATEEAIEKAIAMQERREKETAVKVVEAAPKEVIRESREEATKRARLEEWIPKTLAGRLVKNKDIGSLDELYERHLPIIEPEIIDALLPDLEEVMVDFSKTTRVIKSGRVFSFRATILIGDKNGHVGVGTGKDKERWPAARKALRDAKLNLISVRRGCGSWECVCNEHHSLPFKVQGKNGSVRVDLLPAPKGVGLSVGDAIKPVLRLAGVRDIWAYTSGNSRTTLNYIRATLDALGNTAKMRVSEEIRRTIERK